MRRLSFRQIPPRGIKALSVLGVAVLGAFVIITTHAAQPYTSSEVETGTLSGNASIVSDSNASGSKAVQFGSLVATSAAQVPNVPDIPSSANPSGGWTLEYGDAFGSPSIEQGGQDYTWFPSNSSSCATHQGFLPSQEMENFTCGQVSTNPSTGLTLTCSYGAPSGAVSGGPAINYNCGAAQSAYEWQPTNQYKAFTWEDPTSSGHTIAVQWEWELPPDYQFDPGVWGIGNYTGANSQYGDEIDNLEAFGWGQQADNAANTTTSWTHGPFTMPTFVGTSTYNYLDFTNLGINPEVMNTYTDVYNGSNNTYQAYINDKEVASGSLSSPAPEYQIEIWSMAMRGGWSGCTGSCSDPATGFTSGSHSLTMRYVGYYEDTAHAGQGVEVASCPGGSFPCSGAPGVPYVTGTPPLIAPGSSEESSAATQAAYAQINTQL